MKKFNVCSLCGTELTDTIISSSLGNVCDRCARTVSKDYDKDGK